MAVVRVCSSEREMVGRCGPVAAAVSPFAALASMVGRHLLRLRRPGVHVLCARCWKRRSALVGPRPRQRRITRRT